MFIVGEKLNTSIPEVAKAVELRDATFVQDMARKQAQAGASFVDVNVGTRIHTETEDMEWIVRTIQEALDVSLSIDSPNPEVLRAGLTHHKGDALVNSITLEAKRVQAILPVLEEFRPRVVALTMDDEGIPEGGKRRCEIGQRLIALLTGGGIPEDNIYLDPLIRPISTEQNAGIVVLDAIQRLRDSSDKAHIICGLSNISYGLPKRSLVNRAFLIMAMARGLDAVILDPLDRRLTSLITAGEAVLGKDEYCTKYLGAFRENKLREA